MAAANSANIRIGICEIYFDSGDGSGERFLGHTKGGAEFTVERKFEDLTVDQFGEAPLDKALQGDNLKVKFWLAEITNQNIGLAVSEGVYAPGALGDSKVGLGRDAGFLLSSVAGVLRMHPVRNTPSNFNEDIYIWKAVSVENIVLPFKINEQRIIEITMQALVDPTQPAGFRLGRIGDATIS